MKIRTPYAVYGTKVAEVNAEDGNEYTVLSMCTPEQATFVATQLSLAYRRGHADGLDYATNQAEPSETPVAEREPHWSEAPTETYEGYNQLANLQPVDSNETAVHSSWKDFVK